MALAERILNARHGDGIVDHHTWVIAGDGCLMEGISQEAISLAGHLGLGKLIVLFDDNGISIDGPTSLSTSEDQIARFKASGWATIAIDGHDPAAIRKALAAAKADSSKPWLIACTTRIGYGAPTKEGKASSHGSPLGADEIKGAREKIGSPRGGPPAAGVRARASRGKGASQSWRPGSGRRSPIQLPPRSPPSMPRSRPARTPLPPRPARKRRGCGPNSRSRSSPLPARVSSADRLI
jgi:transketolase